MMKTKYIIKGILDKQEVYFVSFEKQLLWGSEWDVRTCSKTIDGATKYTNKNNAILHCKRLGSQFKVYPVCPRCNKEYDGYPAISRKDNKTKICPDCGILEALNDFKKNNPE